MATFRYTTIAVSQFIKANVATITLQHKIAVPSATMMQFHTDMYLKTLLLAIYYVHL